MNGPDAFGAVPFPDFPKFPAHENFDGVLVVLSVVCILLAGLLAVWYGTHHAPGKGVKSGLGMLLLLTLSSLGLSYYDTGRQDTWEADVRAVGEERAVISARTAQEVADWYGVFPIEIVSDGVEDWFAPAFVEVDGLVTTDCYTLVRDGRLGIACGPEPESLEEALVTLVELPRADERAADRIDGGGR